MSQTSRPIHFGFALCFLFLWLTAAAGQGHNAQSSSRKQVSAYQFCWAGEAVGMHRMFYSGIFVLTTDDARHQAPGAFLKFLEEKYSFKPDPSTELNVSCNDQLTEAGAIKNKQTYLGHGQKGKVVETGWRYGSPTTAPAASCARLSLAWYAPEIDSFAKFSGVLRIGNVLRLCSSSIAFT